MDQSISAVQAGGLIADLAEVTNIEGLLEARVNATGAGASAGEIMDTLTGTVSFDLADGLYKGVDIWHEIRKARALLKREAPPAAPTDPNTPITALGFSGRMADGKLISERMQGEIPFMRLTGDGVLDLAAQSMDYRFRANVFETPVFDDGQDLSGLRNVTIPLTLTGSLDSPSVGVDLAELAKDEAVKKLQDRLFDKLGIGAEEPQPPAGDEQAGDAEQSDAPEQQQRDDARDLLRKGLRDLF